LLIFDLSFVSAQSFDVAVVNVKHHGATGSGEKLDTEAVQKAIDACHDNGGGTVYFPNGIYRVGTIVLKSNVTLHLEAGAKILGSTDLRDYRPLKLRPEEEAKIEGQTKKEDFGALHLIYAQKAKNIGITGRGVIDGSGRAFWDKDFKPLDRPNQMIEFEACEAVTVSGVTLQNAPFWTLHLLSCSHVRIDGISIINPRQGPNTDGIDVNSSSNVFISNVYVETGDDALCFKSRFADEPVQNVTVTNCVLISDDSAIKFGTRSSGDMRNITVSNCVIRNSTNGIAFFMKDGGHFYDIQFSNLSIESASFEERNRMTYPIFMDIEKRIATSKIGRISRISFNGLTIRTGGHCLIGGMREQPIENLVFENIRMFLPECDEIAAKSKPRGVSNLAASPPGTDFAGVPSHWTFAHVQGLTLRNFQISVEQPRPDRHRHAIWGTHLDDVTIDGFNGGPSAAGSELPAIRLEQTKNVAIFSSRATPGTGVFLHVAGADASRVSVLGCDLSAAREPFKIPHEMNGSIFYESNNRLK
jgi:polygalacturonase